MKQLVRGQISQREQYNHYNSCLTLTLSAIDSIPEVTLSAPLAVVTLGEVIARLDAHGAGLGTLAVAVALAS